MPKLITKWKQTIQNLRGTIKTEWMNYYLDINNAVHTIHMNFTTDIRKHQKTSTWTNNNSDSNIKHKLQTFEIIGSKELCNKHNKKQIQATLL